MKSVDELVETAKRYSNGLPLTSIESMKDFNDEINREIEIPFYSKYFRRRVYAMAALGTIILAGGMYLIFNQNQVKDNIDRYNVNSQRRFEQKQQNEKFIRGKNYVQLEKRNDNERRTVIIKNDLPNRGNDLQKEPELIKHDFRDPYEIPGINFLNLTYDEFKKLNVFINKNSIEIITQEIKTVLTESEADYILKDGGTIKEGNYYLATYKNTLENSSSTDEIISVKEFDLDKPDYLHVQPVIYTCRFKDGSSTIHSTASPVLYYSEDSTEKRYFRNKMNFYERTKDIAKQIEQKDNVQINDIARELWNLIASQNELITNNLIPIRIDPKDAEESKPVLDLDKFILFLYPNEEFLEALPERYREQIRNEIRLVNKIRKNEIEPEDACKGLNEKNTLLDICRMQSGAITKAIIYPNPAKYRINIKINLSENREISVSLHDINGGCLLSPVLSKKVDAGEEMINFDIPEMASGIYLVAVQSSKGEQVVQKVMISE